MDTNFIYGGIAAVALFAFIKTRHHRRYAHAFGFDGLGPCGPMSRGPWGHHHHGRGFGRRGFGRGHFGRFGREQFLNHLFDRLETTHGQEEVLKKEWETLQATLRQAREGMQGTAREATKGFTAEQFDRSALDAQFQSGEANMAKVREAIGVFLEKAHAVLDTKQREQVARMLERIQDFRRGF